MFLSFIVPVFNTEEYLAQCLDSLLAQDIADYEILCVDDGSTDDSAAILDAYAHSHSNLLVIHQPNSGVAAARNAGLSAARGKYIWFVDSDDLIRENVLSMLVRRLEETDCDLLEIGGYQFLRTLSDEEKAMGSQLPDNVPGPGSVVWRSLIRREFLLRHDLRFRHPELTHGEDGQFMYELSMENPRVASLDAPLYFYRLRSGSAETAASDQSRLRRMRSHAEVAIIMGKLYAGGRTDARTADRLMATVWSALYDAAGFPMRQARPVLASLGRQGLFPMKNPPPVRQTRSYMTDREDFIGKTFDWLYMHLHKRWGFAAMHLLRCLRSH